VISYCCSYGLQVGNLCSGYIAEEGVVAIVCLAKILCKYFGESHQLNLFSKCDNVVVEITSYKNSYTFMVFGYDSFNCFKERCDGFCIGQALGL
jgi:hypothetical protein